MEGHGIPESEAATLTDVLSNNLLSTGKFRVMERDQMNGILKEQGFQQSGACSDQACLVEMGQILGIEQLVAGSIGKVGKAHSINVRIVSVATGEILRNVSHNYSGPIEELLTQEMGVVAKKLAGVEPTVPPKANRRSLRPVVIGGVAAVFWFLRKRSGGEEETAESHLGGSYHRAYATTWVRVARSPYAAERSENLVFEVDPLECPNCGGTMRIVSFIENSRQPEVVETRSPGTGEEHAEGARRAATRMVAVNILRHCGLWKDTPKRPMGCGSGLNRAEDEFVKISGAVRRYGYVQVM